MQWIKRLLLALVVIGACVGLDRLTKLLAIQYLQGAAPLSFLGDTVRLRFSENTGAFLSLGADLPEVVRFLLFTVLVGFGLVVVGTTLLLVRSWPTHQFIALCLIVGGGLGNLWDRLTRGGVVVDFLNIGIGPVRTGIFNVADVAVMAGVGILLVFGLAAEGKGRAMQADGDPG